MAKRAFLQLATGAASQPEAEADDAVAATRTLIERAYTQLRDDIIEGVLPPGEKLRVEHLKARYGVGAGTLREAITRLVSDALVQAEGQRGFRVAPIAIDDLQDLTQLRIQLEIGALRRSIREGGDGWREQLTRAYDELTAAERPAEPAQRRRWEQLNTRFHETLIMAGATPWTLKVLRLLARHGERYRRYAMALPGSERDVHAEHELIYDAAMAGQEARASLALESHISATAEQLTRAHLAGVQWDRLAGPASDGGRTAAG